MGHAGNEQQPRIACANRQCGRLFARPVSYCPFCGTAQPGDLEQSSKEVGEQKPDVASIIAPSSGPDIPSGERTRATEARKKINSDLPETPQNVSGKPPSNGLAAAPEVQKLDVGSISTSPSGASPKAGASRWIKLIGVSVICVIAIVVVRSAFFSGGAPEPSPTPSLETTTHDTINSGKYLPALSPNVSLHPFTTPSEPRESGPSFDCPGSGLLDERTICANDGLVSMDRRMAAAYQNLKNQQPNGRVPPEVRSYARAALAKRHACGADVGCIMSILLAEKSYFTGYNAGN